MRAAVASYCRSHTEKLPMIVAAKVLISPTEDKVFASGALLWGAFLLISMNYQLRTSYQELK